MVTGCIPTWVYIAYDMARGGTSGILSIMLTQHITRLAGVTRPYPYLEKRHLGNEAQLIKDEDTNLDRKMRRY